MSLTAGQAFGNYRILSRIGVGGMGMVFLAEHPHIGKRVALKIIHHELAGNREVVDRFLNEARAVNQIGSEHIVEIHDFGQTEAGEHFFIMEYLEGRTLAHDMGALDVLEIPRALHIGAQVANALAAAHDAGIIHRDLKPDNVMLIERLGDRDFVKLLDFGLAKFLVDSDARKLTAAGVVLGTPHYMSPEACESRGDIDHRSDLYSLGVLLFQMLTGKLPFTGESMGEVLVKQVAQQPPAPRGINPNIPPAVEQIILRCLAKDTAVRFQSMRELRDALLDPTGYLASSPPVVPSAASAAARTAYGSPSARRRSVPLAAPPPRPPPSDRPTEIALDPDRTIAAWTSPTSGTPPPTAATAYMDESAHRLFAGHMQRPVPQPVENRTMEIGTPHGFRPARRRVVPVAIAVGLFAAAGVVVAVLAMRDQRGAAPAAAYRGAPPASTTLASTPTEPARPAVVADAAPRKARIRLSTRPSGAEVIDEAGRSFGTTPMQITLPIDGREVVLQFRHPDTAPTDKRFVPTGDAAFDIELAPAAAEPGEPGEAGEEPREAEKRPARRRPKSRNDVLRPEF